MVGGWRVWGRLGMEVGDMNTNFIEYLSCIAHDDYAFGN